jgi:uncharacterized protein with PQ loop repeat
MLLLIPATAEPSATSMQVATVLGYLGYLLWTAAYVLFILKGFKERAYGVPLFAICLNVTWELYFAVLCPMKTGSDSLCTSQGPILWARILWLVLDLVILWQLIRYGRNQPDLQRRIPRLAASRIFYALVVISLLVALVWQYTFVRLTTDQDGNTVAWFTNLVMSMLFVRSALFRQEVRGLSFAGGLAMLAGNCAFVGYGVLTEFVEFTAWPRQVTAALMFAVILINCFYLLVLWYRARRPKVVSSRDLSPAAP